MLNAFFSPFKHPYFQALSQTQEDRLYATGQSAENLNTLDTLHLTGFKAVYSNYGLLLKKLTVDLFHFKKTYLYFS